jgi:uncharacterized protein with PQ loop repeat
MQLFVEHFRKAQRHVKAIVATVGSILTAVAGLSSELGITIIDDSARVTVTFILAALTAFSTWAIPNYEIEIKE